MMNFEEFEALKPEEQEKIFHQSPFKEKGDLLLHSHNPLALAQSLSAEELYLLVREVDLEEKSEILRFASLPQLFFISDLDCWKKDRLKPEGFIQWLEALLAADEMKCLQWLTEMDFEVIVTGFKKVSQALKPDREWAADELLGDTPYFTLDDQYYIFVSEENLETVRRAFELLYENVRGKYAAVLEGMMSEMEDELEEEAYYHREIRLAERGFPDFETAHQIYRPLTRAGLEAFPRKDSGQSQGGVQPRMPAKAPNYPVLWSAERLFLDEILLLFREDSSGARERLEEELAWLSNKVIAAEGVDFSSEERVRRGIERARSFVSIGLEELSGRDVQKAEAILRERWLEVIFRWGVTQLMAAREELLAIIREEWNAQRELFLEFINPPYEFIFKGLLLPVPEFHAPDTKDNLNSLRDFRTLGEAERALQSVRQIARMHETLKKNFSAAYSAWKSERAKGNSGVTLFSALGTLFAEFVLSGKLKGEPFLKADILREFVEKAFDQKDKRRFLKTEWKEKFTALHGLSPVLSLVFDEIEDDFSRLNLDSLDPRFISSICIKFSVKGKQNGGPKKKTRPRS